MTLRQYLLFLNRRRWFLVVGILAGSLWGAYSVQTGEQSYRGNVTFFVNTSGEGTVSSANAGDQFALRRVNSYLALLRTDRLVEMIDESLGSAAPTTNVRATISGSADLDTVLLTAWVSHPRRDVATAITDALATQFPLLIQQVEQSDGAGASTVRLVVVSGPGVTLVGVRSKVILVSRALVGMLVGLLAGAVRELADNRLHSLQRALELSNRPLIGRVTRERSAARSPLILDDSLGSSRAEEYRQISTSLQFAGPGVGSRVLVVTSSVPSEGKSVTAANLAISAARAGQHVMLVDADLRDPSIATLFGLEDGVGLVEVLRGVADRKDAERRWGEFELTIISAGGSTSLPSELLGSGAMSRLVDELREEFDTVIVDSSPLVPVTDGAIIAGLADGVVVLCRLGKVTEAEFERSILNLHRVNANVLGIVGTMMTEQRRAPARRSRRSL